MNEKYRENVENLTEDMEKFLVSTIRQTYPEFPDHETIVSSDTHLFDAIVSQGLDHADLITMLATSPSSQAVATMEILVGKPIDRRTPAQVAADRKGAADPAPKKGRKKSADAGPVEKRSGFVRRTSDPRVVASVVANPKRQGTPSYDRFNIWKVGMTVDEAIQLGMKREDVKWDWERKFVTFVGDDAPPAPAETTDAPTATPESTEAPAPTEETAQ